MRTRLSAVWAGLALAVGIAMAAPTAAHAQLVDRKGLSLAEARKMLAAAQADAAKSNLTVAIAIVDEGGHLLLFEKMDGTQTGSVAIAISKARTAVLFKRPTKVFEDAVAGGRTAILSLEGVTPLAGGLPVMLGTTAIGAIGVSGATSQQDGAVAAAGLAAGSR
jgi:uncharacterized protein GlcG (DUF336 family)